MKLVEGIQYARLLVAVKASALNEMQRLVEVGRLNVSAVIFAIEIVSPTYLRHVFAHVD